MVFRNFEVGPARGLARAAMKDAPDLMVIVGPNGAGKSTMLYELQRAKDQAEPDTRILYINPNRPWKRLAFGLNIVQNLPYSLNELYERESFPGWQNYQPNGFVSSGLPRSPDNVDDIQGLVKFALARLEQKRQVALVAAVDAAPASIADPTIVNAFEPLREMVRNLLPHLRFKRIDVSDPQSLRVVLEKLDGDVSVELDLDDLSSGEKAVFQLFMPFMETQVEDRIENRQHDPRSIVAIIDEPELHLHPALQVGLVTYLRHLSETHNVQFIVATHSTTIMDVCEEDELFLLAPPATVGGQNQLVKLTTSSQRLEAVRELTGSTYAVTRCRPIVFVEGEVSGTKDITDQRLMETVVPEARGWVVVPAKGRAETLRSATALRDPTLTGLPGVPVFALVDRDTSDSLSEDCLLTWPVCMIENLLLDPDAIWTVLGPVREKVSLRGVADVQAALDAIARDQIDKEVDLRVRRQRKTFRYTSHMTPTDELSKLETNVGEEVRKHLTSLGSGDDVAAFVAEKRSEVQGIIDRREHLELFHGKDLLKSFYENSAKASGYSYVTFCYSVANAARQGERLQRLITEPVRKIRQFTSAGLLDVLEEIVVVTGDADGVSVSLRDEVKTRREAWQEGREVDPGSDLRSRLTAFARALDARGMSEVAARVRVETAVMGVD